MAQILTDLMWYSASMAELYLIGWLIYSGLRREYPCFFFYILASVLQTACLIAFRPNSYAYAQVWAHFEYVVLGAQVAVVWEVVRKMRRAYPENRDFTFALVATATVLSVLLSIAMFRIELPHIRWDKPLFVQLTIVAARVGNIALAGFMPSFLASVWWAGQLPRSLNRHLWILTGHLFAYAIGHLLVMVFLANRPVLPWIGVGQMSAVFLSLLAWCILFRPEADEPIAETEARPAVRPEIGGLQRSVN